MEFVIQGKSYTYKAPRSFAEREELVQALLGVNGVSSGFYRALSAMIGLCSPVGKEAKADYAKCRFDPLEYGGVVYSYLREQGAGYQEIFQAGLACKEQLEQVLYPRADEVDEAAKN